MTKKLAKDPTALKMAQGKKGYISLTQGAGYKRVHFSNALKREFF